MMTRDAPTFQHGRLQMQCSLTGTLRPEVILNVGLSAKQELILSKLHIPSSDMGSLGISIAANSFCFSGPEGEPRQRFGAEHEPACALPSTQ